MLWEDWPLGANGIGAPMGRDDRTSRVDSCPLLVGPGEESRLAKVLERGLAGLALPLHSLNPSTEDE